MLLVFVSTFSARVGVAVGIVIEVHFIHRFNGLGQIVLKRGDGRAHGRRPEPVRNKTEVSQTALNARLEYGLRA